MSGRLTWLFALVCGLSVANVYYAQPLLDAIAHDFAIPMAAAGAMITATQIGCGLALVFVVPLGDMIDRRRLILAQLTFLAVALASTGYARTSPMLMPSAAAVGLFGTAMTQGMIAFAASLAPPESRGRIVGVVSGGVVIGLLLARTFAGVVCDLAGWRAVYFLSAGISLAMLAVLWRVLPVSPRPGNGVSYRSLLGSMRALLAKERVLQERGVLGMLMFASLSTFWTALVLPLSAPPYSLTHATIGFFGLAGLAGALAAARTGRFADRGQGELATGIGVILLIAGWGLASVLPHSIWWLVLGVVLLDMGGQAIHVVNQSMIFSIRPEAQSRLVGCYMLFYAIGSGAGAIGSTLTYARFGWTGVCCVGAAISFAALLFWAACVGARAAGGPAAKCSEARR